MKKKLLSLLSIIIFCLFCSRQGMSQSVIRGIIKDQGGRPVQYTNVLLLKSLDSSLVKGTISDSSGKYTFENIKKGAYCITASFTGMEQVYSKVFEIISDKDKIDEGVLHLGNTDVRLKEITVAAKKPMFEQKIDRMVINVKN
ncbi:MAG: carboxypeptidase-like regulatory domain-containing protein, partial [Ginsengibacter sp.]